MNSPAHFARLRRPPCPEAEDRQAGSFRRTILTVTPLLALIAAGYLMFLGVKGAPLPVGSPELACALGAAYCVGLCALTLYVGRFQLFSFPGAFLGVSGLYMVGLLIAFPLQGDAAFAIWHVVDMEAILQGVPLVMLAFTGFLLGSIWAVTRRLPPPDRVPSLSTRFDLFYVRLIGGFLFGLAVLVIVIDTARGAGLMYALEGGYYYLAEVQYQGDGLGLVGAALIWLLPWGAIILTAGADQRRHLWWLLPVIAVANVILIIAGDRGGLFVLDLVVVMRAALRGFRLRWWQGLGLAAAIIVAIPTMMVLRQLPFRSWTPGIVLDALTFKSDGALGTDPISATLVEGGLSYKVLMGTLAMVPHREDFHYGADYLFSLPVAIPFASRFLPDTISRNDLWVKDYVEHQLSTSGIGFLQVAEAYVQFGAWGVFGFFVLMGFLVPYIWRRCAERPMARSHMAYALILANTILLWIRNEFHIVVKPTVWCFILLVALPWLLGGRFRRRTSDTATAEVEDPPTDAREELVPEPAVNT